MRVVRAFKWALFLTCLGWGGYSAYFIFQTSNAFYRAFPQAGPPEVSGIPNLLAGLQFLAVIAGPALLAGALLLIKFPSKKRRSG
jgi:hypothetical protein